MSWAFCEPETAGSMSRWCLRPMTKQGLKPSGGVDTNSLCGRVKAHHGWDIQVPVTQDRIDHPDVMCPKCRVELGRAALRGGSS